MEENGNPETDQNVNEKREHSTKAKGRRGRRSPRSVLRRMGGLMKAYPVLCVILLAQIGVIVYLNLFTLRFHLGYDMSANFLYTMEAAKERTLVPKHYEIATALGFDSFAILSVTLCAVTGKLYFSYGLSLLISAALLCWSIWAVANRLGLSTRAKLLLFIFILTPYIGVANSGNPLDYFYMTFFSMGAYTVRLAMFMLIWYTFLVIEDYRRGEDSPVKLAVLIFLSTMSCLVCGLGTGITIVAMCLIPALGAMMVRFFATGKFGRNGTMSELFVVAGILAAALGRMIALVSFGKTTQDMTIPWVMLENLWSNIGSVFLGFLKIMAAVPVRNFTIVMSITGILYGMRFILAMMVFLGAALCIANVMKSRSWESKDFFLVTVLLFGIAVFFPIVSTYGAIAFEERYLIQLFYLLLMLAMRWFDRHCLQCEAGGNALQTTAIFLLIVVNITSFFYITDSQTDYGPMDRIVSAADSAQAGVVYMSDNELMSRNLRVVDSDVIYKFSADLKSISHWGDYTYCDEAGEYTGPTLLVCSDETYEQLPAYIAKQYELMEPVPQYGFNIYEADHNPVDFKSGLTESELNIDFPYTNGIMTSETGTFDDEGCFVSDGTEGVLLSGPFCHSVPGIYDFTLNYEVVSCPEDVREAGMFDITVDSVQIAAEPITAGKMSLTISGVELGENGLLEYRVSVGEGVILKVKSYEIRRIEAD